jgi:hypothetical protein
MYENRKQKMIEYKFDRKRALERYFKKREKRWTGKVRKIVTPRSIIANKRVRTCKGRFIKSSTQFMPLDDLYFIDEIINYLI